MVFCRSEYCRKRHKPKYFHIIFHLVKHQNQNLQFQLYHRNNKRFLTQTFFNSLFSIVMLLVCQHVVFLTYALFNGTKNSNCEK